MEAYIIAALVFIGAGIWFCSGVLLEIKDIMKDKWK